VLTRGVAYDQSADWFSYGCTMFKLLRGHSPFRTPTTKDRNEIDKLTLTGVSLTCIYVGSGTFARIDIFPKAYFANRNVSETALTL